MNYIQLTIKNPEILKLRDDIRHDNELRIKHFIDVLTSLPKSTELSEILYDVSLSDFDKVCNGVDILTDTQIRELLLVDVVHTTDGLMYIYSLKKTMCKEMSLLMFGSLHEMSKRVSPKLFISLITPLLIHLHIALNSDLEISVRDGDYGYGTYTEVMSAESCSLLMELITE